MWRNGVRVNGSSRLVEEQDYGRITSTNQSNHGRGKLSVCSLVGRVDTSAILCKMRLYCSTGLPQGPRISVGDKRYRTDM